MQVSDRWQSRKMLQEQIKSFGKLPDPRDISIAKLDEYNTKITQVRERIGQVKSQRTEIKREAMSLPINRMLWAQKSRIEAITEHIPWVESLQRQSERLKDEIDTLENSLVGEVDGLGHQLKIRAKDVKDLGSRGFASLEPAVKNSRKEKERLARTSTNWTRSNSISASTRNDWEIRWRRRAQPTRSRIPADTSTACVDGSSWKKRSKKLNQNRHDLERDIDTSSTNRFCRLASCRSSDSSLSWASYSWVWTAGHDFWRKLAE